MNNNQQPPLEQANVLRRLKAIQKMKSDPELVKLLAEFKRLPMVPSIIMQYQIETEEEWAAHWLSQIEAQVFASNGA